MSNILRIKEDWDSRVPVFRNKVSRILNSGNENASGVANPFLNKGGNIVNPYIDYQRILNSNNVPARMKEFIQQATGLSPSVTETDGTFNYGPVKSNEALESNSQNTIKNTSSLSKPQPQNSSQTNSIGKKVANTANYSNDAAKGQCVWYVRGRAVEKLGKDTDAIGNANQMWHNAKSEAKVAAKTDNIKPNMIVSYQSGTSSGGKAYGHVIFIEDVVGDTVYYTEGGSGYHKNGTDGVVKTATKQGILDGVNANGGRMGSGVIGFIDLSKY